MLHAATKEKETAVSQEQGAKDAQDVGTATLAGTRAGQVVVSRGAVPWPWNSRSILAENCLCPACSSHEIFRILGAAHDLDFD
jgi:hypothetical protein